MATQTTGLPEERAETGGSFFLADALLFRLLFLLRFGGSGSTGGGCRCGGREARGGLDGLLDVHAFQACGEGLDACSVGRDTGRLEAGRRGRRRRARGSRRP